MASTALIESKPAITKVGNQGIALEYYVQTQYQVDDSGKLVEGSAKSFIAYNNSTIPGVKNFVQAAETSDGGANWTFKNGTDGKPILGADAQRSLKEGALKTDTQKAIIDSAQTAASPLSTEDQKQLAASTKNQATATGQAQTAAALQQDLGQSKGGTRISFPQNLKYPSNLQIEHQDVIKFNMLKYEKRSNSETANQGLGSFGERSDFTSRTIGSVFLPIPGGISDTNAVSWGSDSLPAGAKALADLANAMITGGGDEAARTAERQTEQVSQSSTEIQKGLAAYFTEQAIGQSNILSRTQGAIQNPNMELLFSGPSLRPFNFTFKFSARGESDREQIRKIIRFFKQGMSVQRTESQLFLKAPNTFKIQYLHKSKDHPYINFIKECALQSFTVNYTPEGNYMTFADGLMTSYEVSMQFQELEPIFNDDYAKLPGSNSDTVIGY